MLGDLARHNKCLKNHETEEETRDTNCHVDVWFWIVKNQILLKKRKNSSWNISKKNVCIHSRQICGAQASAWPARWAYQPKNMTSACLSRHGPKNQMETKWRQSPIPCQSQSIILHLSHYLYRGAQRYKVAEERNFQNLQKTRNSLQMLRKYQKRPMSAIIATMKLH